MKQAMKILLVFLLNSSVITICHGCIDDKGDKLPSGGLYVLNNFNFELNRILSTKKKHENYAYSSYSLMSAMTPMMSMLGDNAKHGVQKCLGTTEEKLENVLTSNKENINIFNEATKIWMDKTVNLNNEKIKKLSPKTVHSFQLIDIKTNPEVAERRINSWVEDETHGMIKDLLKPGVLSSTTKMVITNAVSFRGSWKMTFDKELTRKRPFHVTADKVIQVPTMINTIHANYYRGELGQMLEMPYKGDKYSMYIVIPKTLNAINTKLVTKAMTEMQKMKIEVVLPKFKITSSLNMREYINAMGLHQLFGRVEVLNDGVYFTEVIHKVSVIVDESGTVASGGTAVLTGRSMIPMFRANKPFYFFIKNLKSNVIIFSGMIYEPQW